MLQAAPQLDTSSVQQLYSQLCSTPASPSTRPQLPHQEVTKLYIQGLAAAADIQRKSVRAGTLKVRQSAMRELADWLHGSVAAEQS